MLAYVLSCIMQTLRTAVALCASWNCETTKMNDSSTTTLVRGDVDRVLVCHSMSLAKGRGRYPQNGQVDVRPSIDGWVSGS